MKPCLSEATTMPATFAEDVEAYARGGWPAMEVWLTKLEKHLETHSVADTRKLLGDSGLVLAAASYQGGLLLSQGEQRQAHYDHFKRRLELCQQLAIPTLLVVADRFRRAGGRRRLGAGRRVAAPGGAVGRRLWRAPRPGVPRLGDVLLQPEHGAGSGGDLRRAERRRGA
jgi:sugar phosphate isomerase/epimerase